REVDRAGVLVGPEDFLPRRAAVARAEHAALRVRAVRMAERCGVDDVRVGRMHDHAADLLRIVEADVRPRLPAVGRLVHAVALGDVGAHVGLAAADVNHLRIRRRHGQRADRADRLPVEDRLPRAAGVDRLPHPAVHAAEVEMLRLARHARDREDAAGAKRPDEAPAQLLEMGRIDGRIGTDRQQQQQAAGQTAQKHRSTPNQLISFTARGRARRDYSRFFGAPITSQRKVFMNRLFSALFVLAVAGAAAAQTNPFFAPSPLPFNAPQFDKIKDSDYKPALEEGMKRQLAEIDTIANRADAPTFANTVEAMERSGDLLTRTAKVFFALTQANTNDTLQKLEGEEAPKLAAH